MNNEINDAFLREFLLGKINDEERGRIEDLFLTDPQARERVLGVEQDLIEDYLEGTLTASDKERFVSLYAQTAEQRRRLRITKSIKDWAMAEAASSVPVKESGRRGSRPWAGWRPVFVIPIAAMAMLAIIVAAVWLNRRAAHSAIEQELAQLNTPSNLPQASVGMELSPVMVRDSDSQNHLLTPALNEVVVLRLLWIQKERYSSYEAKIRRLGESRSFVVPNLQPESDGKAIRIKLPAHILTRGTYQIELSGRDAGGPASPSEEYSFAVAGTSDR